MRRTVKRPSCKAVQRKVCPKVEAGEDVEDSGRRRTEGHQSKEYHSLDFTNPIALCLNRFRTCTLLQGINVRIMVEWTRFPFWHRDSNLSSNCCCVLQTIKFCTLILFVDGVQATPCAHSLVSHLRVNPEVTHFDSIGPKTVD
eukprot:6422482-Amphidinium_carterae.1